MSALFTPLEIGSLKLANRIVIAPMCQYSAEDGCMTDWHMIHLGHLALSGAALLTIEATAVTPEGRISYGDTGLWSDENEGAMARVLESVRRWSDMPIAIQLAHAGRKASTDEPWFGGAQIAPERAEWLADGRAVAAPVHGGREPAGGARPRRARPHPPRRSPMPQSGRRGSTSTRCSSTARTAICCTSSSRRSRTGAPTNMAAASRTACASRSKCSTPCAPRSPPSGR